MKISFVRRDSRDSCWYPVNPINYSKQDGEGSYLVTQILLSASIGQGLIGVLSGLIGVPVSKNCLRNTKGKT